MLRRLDERELGRMRQIELSLNLLTSAHYTQLGCEEIIEQSPSIESMLQLLAETVSYRFPITVHRYNLGDPILIGTDKAQTDCRLSAVIMGELMQHSNRFDTVALAHQHSADIHIGVVGFSQGSVFHAHFFEPAPGFRVSTLSGDKLQQNTLFEVNAAGIIKLDRHLMVG